MQAKQPGMSARIHARNGIPFFGLVNVRNCRRRTMGKAIHSSFKDAVVAAIRVGAAAKPLANRLPLSISTQSNPSCTGGISSLTRAAIDNNRDADIETLSAYLPQRTAPSALASSTTPCPHTRQQLLPTIGANHEKPNVRSAPGPSALAVRADRGNRPLKGGVHTVKSQYRPCVKPRQRPLNPLHTQAERSSTAQPGIPPLRQAEANP